MADPRVEAYARLLVEYSVGVEPGWQVAVLAGTNARPLVEAVIREIAGRGAYPLVHLTFSGRGFHDQSWLESASDELLERAAPLAVHEAEQIDAHISIDSPENTKALGAIAPERIAKYRESILPLVSRTRSNEIPWVICQWPTPALAQDAGMDTASFAEFLFGAVLLDWQAESQKMERIKERFDGASEVRIVGAGTDIVLGLEGRAALIDDGHLNMPGGEVYYGPVEDATEGTITYSEFPANYLGREVAGARLVFQAGRVVEASAQSGEDFLIETLDTDEGARVLGELGIGCNPGIDRYMKNTLFDEKIAGTVHLAVGNSYTSSGGTNKSAVHWDMVKDLRAGGELHLDGEVVQRDGNWLF
ncbi:MAG: aminopeptidase [Gaiellaceae bacterium]|nr:aminopeptidase [Gaiellaceae bacterium]